MSRSATAGSGDLWVFSDNDNPGAGTKGVTKAAGGTGLNANWETLQVGVFTEHNTNGTHRNDKIIGANLNANVVDDSTLQVSATTGVKVLRIKDAGVTMAKIAQAGATAGQAITWTGSAWAPGNPTAALGTASVTRLKLESKLGGFLIWGDPRAAGLSAGNVPAAQNEWVETSTTYVKKFSSFINKKDTMGTCRFSCELKSNSVGVLARVQVDIGGVSGSATVAGNSYDYAAVTLDLTSLAEGEYEVVVNLRVDTSGTATMTLPILHIDPV